MYEEILSGAYDDTCQSDIEKKIDVTIRTFTCFYSLLNGQFRKLVRRQWITNTDDAPQTSTRDPIACTPNDNFLIIWNPIFLQKSFLSGDYITRSSKSDLIIYGFRSVRFELQQLCMRVHLTDVSSLSW